MLIERCCMVVPPRRTPPRRDRRTAPCLQVRCRTRCFLDPLERAVLVFARRAQPQLGHGGALRRAVRSCDAAATAVVAGELVVPVVRAGSPGECGAAA